MRDWSKYYKNEVDKLQSLKHGVERVKVSTMKAISIMKFLIERENLDNGKTNKISKLLEESLEAIEDLESDPLNGECPYNDPTLDINDPYYMKRPLGRTPEELSELAENIQPASQDRHGSDTFKGIIAQTIDEPVFKPGEQEARFKNKEQ